MTLLKSLKANTANLASLEQDDSIGSSCSRYFGAQSDSLASISVAMLDNIVQVYLDVAVNNQEAGRLVIKLYRDLFPEGVQNFISICQGNTNQQIPTGYQDKPIWKTTKRSFEGCVFYRSQHNGYLLSGDIYANNGSSAGTIYDDQPITIPDPDRYIPHEIAGLVSLVPRTPTSDDPPGQLTYDSTFLITLAPPNPSVQAKLDRDQIVIGHLVQGSNVLEAINQEISPRRPDGGQYRRVTIVISECGVIPSVRAGHRKRG